MLACIQPPKDTEFSPGSAPAPAPAIALAHGTSLYNTQNDLLLHKVLRFYNENDGKHMETMLSVINGGTNISLRIMDWFVTNYSKKHYTVYELVGSTPTTTARAKRFKVYVDYKLKLRAYSKKRFDPFCRWDRINVPHKNGTMYIQTTLGQLNFFKWAIENEVIRYIQENYTAIETDMNIRNNTTRRLAKSHHTSSATVDGCVLASGSDAISSVTADHSVIVLASGSDAISSVTADHSVASGFVLASGSDAISSVTADHSVIVLASGSDAISSVTADHSVASGSSVVSGSVVASKANVVPSQGGGTPKQRKKREELSSSATKSIKKEFVDIVITFD
jgi:hypothetical protein